MTLLYILGAAVLGVAIGGLVVVLAVRKAVHDAIGRGLGW